MNVMLVLLFATFGLNIVFIVILLNKNKNQISVEKYTELNSQLIRYKTENEYLIKIKDNLSSDLESSQSKYKDLEQAAKESNEQKNQLQVQVERLNIENNNLKQAYAQLSELLINLRQDLTKDFTTIKNQALNDLKLEAGSSLRSIGKEELVAPLNNTLKNLQEDIIKLQAETSTINKSSIQLNLTAQNLADALVKDSKKKGNFGEMILANILEGVGLKDKISYIEQEYVNYASDVYIPDLVVNLPENRALVIDSKNIVGSYYTGQIEGDGSLLMTKKALEKAVNDLSNKKYVTAIEAKLGKQVFEYMILFIPNENLFNHLLQEEHLSPKSIIDRAYEQKIIIAGPSTILTLVALIDKMWQTAQTDERAMEIIKLANDLCAKLKTTIEIVNKLGSNLRSSFNNYNDLIGSLDNGESRSAINKLTTLAGYKDFNKQLESVEINLRTPASLS